MQWRPGPVPEPPVIELYGEWILALFSWWWESLGLSRAEVIVGTIGGLLALLALLYARHVSKKQFEMLDKQDGIIREQRDLLKENRDLTRQLETLAREQKAILEEQGRIARQQHEIMEDQRSRVPYLRVETGTLTREYDGAVVPVNVCNDGNGMADGCYWQVVIPAGIVNDVRFTTPDGAAANKNMVPGKHEWLVHGTIDTRIYPKRKILLVTLLYDPKFDRTETVVLHWQLASDRGSWPVKGSYVTTLARQENKSVRVFYRIDADHQA